MRAWIREWAQTLIAVVILVGAVIGFETHYAKSSDLKLVAFRLDQKIASDRYLWLKQHFPEICTQQARKNKAQDELCFKMEQEIRDFESRKSAN